MGILASYVDHRVGNQLGQRRLVVWYDPGQEWKPWIDHLLGGQRSPALVTQAEVGQRRVHLAVGMGSLYELLHECAPLTDSEDLPYLLVYLPGEPHLETLSPLRELECLGGERDPYQPNLLQVARQAFQSAGLSEGEIDELLDHEGLDYDYLDAISIGKGDVSPLDPVFGSSREVDVMPLFLTDPSRRAEVAAKGLMPEILKLAQAGLGLRVDQVADEPAVKAVEPLAHSLTRLLLVAEMRSDLDGPEPLAISQLGGPSNGEQVDRVRAVCRRLRAEHAETYEELAATVERELGLASAGIDPATLGRIDTFRFEEQQLLAACDRWLVEAEPDRVRETVNVRLREGSFWASVTRFPERHAAWEAAGQLAKLSMAVQKATARLGSSPKDPSSWVELYTDETDGLYQMDLLYRDARYRLSGLTDTTALASGAARVFSDYEVLLDRMANDFTGSLEAASWSVPGPVRQEEIFEQRVAKRPETVAYILADAMRYEMGVALKQLVEAVGATSTRVEPAVAVMPTITDMGMVALLPGAERSFSMAETSKGICGSIGGKAIDGSVARMSHAQAEVPSLVEMTLDRLVHELTPEARAKAVKGAKVVVIRSQEIDGSGESLSPSLARKVMGTVLEELRRAVQCLAEAGVQHFVITADHGHLFGETKGDDMKIDPPEAGKKVDLHRRCWVGRGGSTPSGCVRLKPSDLGYEGTDLELVVPRGLGVFKSGGSLAYHHGGLSLQELIIPVLTFELEGKASKKAKKTETVLLEAVDKLITNRIFSLRLSPKQVNWVEPLKIRVIAQATDDKRTVAQSAWASEGWDPEGKIITFVSGAPVDIRMLLDDDSVAELRIVVMQVDTDRALKDTEPIPVNITR